MKKFLRWVVFIPVGALIVLFLIANRQPVALSLDPFSTESPALATPPVFLWVWLILSVLIGFFIGAAGMWMSGRELRIRAKADRLELKSLKKAAAEPLRASKPPLEPTEQV
ncbi:MAG: LapA family protein [Pseudomonadota bacterium]